ncbi:hypothetical protein AVEN_107066-1 [Araneus ventricosus]|uniref:Uncharacterized protein n=1 Tax=Araneus ventricosus TaxID=182803 RepID=A0A4Y2UB97_ARAVE|nr:hypothetical protein AVEN_107066-1 [Araneus ventricosus]
MRPGLLSTAVVGDRFGFTDRAVIAIASSVLHYLGVITSNNSDLVVDKNKLRILRITRSLSQFLAIGCDGASVNTEWKSGAIRCLELKIGKLLHWVIYLLHFNELTLRYLFETLDGPTNGPKSSSGNIGKAFLTCKTLPATTIEIIDGELSTTGKRDLRKNQIYLIEISQAVQLVYCSEELARRTQGTLSHARWLTTANRVLRLYVSSPAPSLKFKQIIEYLSQDLKDVVDGVICRNSFFAHPENILLCMLKDERPHIRELAARRIIKSRESSSNVKSVRVFLRPKLNFEAADYTEIIVRDKKNVNWDFVHFPCHSHARQWRVKLVTEASSKSEVVRPGIFPTVTPIVTKVSAAVRTLDRFVISDRTGAAILSAALQDVGIISESNVLSVVDKNKIRRGRTKARTNLLSQVIKHYDHDQFGLYFDGRKDRTLSVEDNKRKFIIEEHISLVKEPGSEYIGHVSVNFGRAQIIGNNIYSLFVMR